MLELRDPEQVRHWVQASLWFARAGAVTGPNVTSALRWLLALASEGHPTPPVGFLLDLGAITFGEHDVHPVQAAELPGVEAGLLRRYEDYVLGKLYADLSLERAADAVLGLPEAQRDEGLAWLAHSLLAQTGFPGAIINPAAVRALQQLPPEELLAAGWQHLANSGPPPELIAQYEALIEATKSTGDLVPPEDLFELERGIALADYGQRLALRQVLRAAATLSDGIGPQRPKSRQRRQAATHLLAEDAYPVGGFSSISTKGTIESLLHSQLAYIEVDDRPDLFDIKYVRDELLYYSRDENQFLRRRTTLLVALLPDLVTARVKDAALPFQRIVLTLGLLVALAQKLSQWLSDEALELHFMLVQPDDRQPLAQEQGLLELLLADEIQHGTAIVESVPRAKVMEAAVRHGRRSQVRGIAVSVAATQLLAEVAESARLEIGALPTLYDGGQLQIAEEVALEAWREALRTLLTNTL